MRVEKGQIIVVASRARIRRIPASLLALRAESDFDLEEAMQDFVREDLETGAGSKVRNGRVEKRALDFINWAIRRGLVGLVSPLPVVWDLAAMGQMIGEPSRGQG